MGIEDKYEEVRHLINLGREKGYLVYDEVNDILPEEVNSPEEIDDIFLLFDQLGIEVVDSESAYKRKDEKIELRGFGSFRVRGRKPRRARNPKTGSGLHVPEKRVPFFKVGRHLREFLKQGRDGAASVPPGSVPTPPRAIEEIFL